MLMLKVSVYRYQTIPVSISLVGVYLIWTAATALLLIPRSPELLIERMARRKDAKTWDMALMSIVGLATLAKHIVAGFDFQKGWTSNSMNTSMHRRRVLHR